MTGKTPGQIRAAIGRAVLKAGPDAARRRREEAEKDPRVELWREDAGTAAICGYGLPPDAALAADQAITTAALDLKAAGMPGTMDQLRARAYLDALLGQDSRPAARQPAAPQPTATETPGRGDPQRGEPPARRPPARRPAGAEHLRRRTSGAEGRRRGWRPARWPTARRLPARSPRPAARPAGRAGTGPPPPAAAINLTIPLTTLLGLTGHPGEAAAFGPIDAALARTLAAHAAGNPATTWCITVTDEHGHPTAHGCAQPGRRGKPRRTKNPGGPPPGGRTGPADADGSPPGETITPASAKTSPPGTGGGPPGTGSGPPGGDGTWRLRLPGHTLDLTATLEPLAVTECDHRHQTTAHDPGRILRHLVQIRDGDCTYPPCLRDARRCDFEHAMPWEQGGRTCACNTGPRCRHHHHVKQAAGWTLEQNQPGYHTWTTPAGRRYTTGPTTYPI